MNKFANVVYAYSAKNDDELELKVGDRIEVIGVEEEGMYLNSIYFSYHNIKFSFMIDLETNIISF